LKVGLFKHQFTGFGGTERVIVEYMNRSKHNTVLFTDKNGIDKLPWFTSKHKFIEVTPASVSLVERLHPAFIKFPSGEADVVIAFLGELLSESVILKNKSIPSIAYLAGIFRFADLLENKLRLPDGSLTPLSKVYGRLSCKFLKDFTKIVTNSYYVKERVMRLTPIASNCLDVIHPGVDTVRFQPTYCYRDYFLVVCRLERLKRVDLIIEAFKIFQTLSNKRFKLIIAGFLKPSNFDYLLELKQRSNNSVEFVINPSDERLLRLYQDCYCFIFTSFKEPFGITPLEAMSCAKPVIATGEGGFTDYIFNQENGFLTNTSAYSVAKRMLLLAENRRLLERLGQKARETSLQYDWSHFVSQMDALVDLISE